MYRISIVVIDSDLKESGSIRFVVDANQSLTMTKRSQRMTHRQRARLVEHEKLFIHVYDAQGTSEHWSLVPGPPRTTLIHYGLSIVLWCCNSLRTTVLHRPAFLLEHKSSEGQGNLEYGKNKQSKFWVFCNYIHVRSYLSAMNLIKQKKLFHK